MAVGLLLFQSLDLHTGQLPARVSTDEALKAAAAQFPLFSFVPNLEVLQCRAELRAHTHTLTHSLSRRTINRLRADFSFTLPIVNSLSSCSVDRARKCRATHLNRTCQQQQHCYSLQFGTVNRKWRERKREREKAALFTSLHGLHKLSHSPTLASNWGPNN